MSNLSSPPNAWHATPAIRRKAGLKAHTREDLLKGGKSGPSIIPGKGAESLLIAKMEGRRGLRMPPSGPPLAPEVIERIRLWIDEGAKFDGRACTSERIARLAPRSPALPPGTASHPIDRFIDAYFAKRGVKPPKLVSDALFARRAWLDTSGLPPTPEELREFENSKESDKRARVIDRLLADRQAYAENWISFWNDLLRNDEGVIYHGERKIDHEMAAWGAREQYPVRRNGAVAARSARKDRPGRISGRCHLARRRQRESDPADAGRTERGAGLPRHQHEMRGLPRQLHQSLEIARYLRSGEHVLRKAA